ncbi:CDP-alcohol phosphatidyltransferase family protein [Endozoicomonas sp. SM1973]|uniref:CDP-alcohol phosphatidyltransferase family protein n=1 Tax=Spartinivicinus marinus TaxID=2994442 RepID=A0A853I2K7_9GAMM|nr:CDP-alcohol phosphatidyltransferase family protein [Spartinivicinus marinus]MCX4029383.1 CDP-alcohol phosphatidyltransferase family protein [Spartinivicinus marinus]NYZ64958.1 CDP-alcohol phosphatidyltransferase family protein [Spartinivicinus marinus]
MVSIYDIKPKFQQLLLPVLHLLHRTHITANQITLTAIVFSLIIGFTFWHADSNHWLFLVLPIGLFIRMALNALDGMMARTYNQQSTLGEVLNEVGDIISDWVIFFPLLKFFPEQLYLVVAFLCLSILSEFAGLLGKVIADERRYDGPMGKSDRAFVVGACGLALFLGWPVASYGFWIFLIVNSLLMMSIFFRIKRALHSVV